MTQDKDRAAFEAWYSQHHGHRDMYEIGADGEYIDKTMQGALNVWQAAIAHDRQQRGELIGYISYGALDRLKGGGFVTLCPTSVSNSPPVYLSTAPDAAPQPAELATFRAACNQSLQPSGPVKGPSDEDIIQLFVDMVQKDEIGRPVMDISMKEAIEVSRELLRRYGNAAQPRPSDDELWGQTLRERDAASEMADKLADAIAKHLGIDIGEHTSSNHPWYRALDAIEIAQHAEPVAWISRETLLGMHKAPQMNIVLNQVYLRCSQVYEDEVPLFLGPQPADHFADVRKMLPSDAEIREVFLSNGFTIKPGLDDLKPYVYEAARDLLSRYGNAVQANKETP